jgi:septal ring factor EnvC (AmiA/AmiB activator)
LRQPVPWALLAVWIAAGPAAGAEAEAWSLRDALIAAAGAVQAREREIAGLGPELAALTARESELSQRFAGEAAASGRLLLVLQRLARLPAGAVLAAGPDPAAAVRGAMVVGSMVAAVSRRAAGLQADLDALVGARRAAGEKRAALDLAAADLDNARRHLHDLLHQHAGLRQRLAAAPAGPLSQDLVGEALAVAGLLAPPEAEAAAPGAAAGGASPQPADPVRPDAESEAAIAARPPPAFPAVGRVIGRFGEPEESGRGRRGIAIATAGGAQVVAPAAGRVVFAGPFRGYGLLLIVEHADGYHSLLAGLARIDLGIGQQVVTGEPVGIMGGPTPGDPVLYLELRQGGHPIDPLPWLAGDTGKASG